MHDVRVEVGPIGPNDRVNFRVHAHCSKDSRVAERGEQSCERHKCRDVHLTHTAIVELEAQSVRLEYLNTGHGNQHVHSSRAMRISTSNAADFRHPEGSAGAASSEAATG